MIAAAYAEALRQRVSPGIDVLDLGGDLGQRAVLACRLGARRVYAVHTGRAAAIAGALAAANGCVDRIEIVDDPLAVALDRSIDLVLAALPGELPVHGGSLQQLRARLQGQWPSGAASMPVWERLWVGLAAAESLYQRHVSPWEGIGSLYDMTAARELAVNTWSRVETAGDLIGAPQVLGAIAFGAAASTGIDGRLAWHVAHGVVAHGLAVWPEVVLTEAVVMANRWEDERSAVGRAFFPWPRPVALRAGDRVTVTIQATALGTHDTWSWTSLVTREGDEVVRFTQSTFLGSLELPAMLKPR